MNKQWSVEEHDSNLYALYYFIAIATVILAFLFQEMIFLTVSIVLFLLFGINKLYLRVITKNLIQSNTRQIIRLFPDDEETLTFTFENKGLLPIIKANWRFSLYDPDESLWVKEIKRFGNTFIYYHPFFLISARSKRTFSLKVKGVKRGYAQVKDLEIVLHDLVGFSHVRLKDFSLYEKEMITYPSLSSMQVLDKKMRLEQGETPTNFSLFEDSLQPRGSREYTNEDPFHRINWKDSARSGQLQTKIVDRIMLSQWTFVLNLRRDIDTYPMIEDVETVFSQAAFLSQLAYKKGIAVEIYINLNIIDSPTGLYIPPGNDIQHLLHIFEMFARIRNGALTIDPNQMYSILHRNVKNGQILFHFGEFSEKEMNCYGALRRRGVEINRIDSSDTDEAVVHEEVVS